MSINLLTYLYDLLLHFPPLLSTRAFFYSCIFHPCNFARIAFSTPAFSVAPHI